MYRLRGYAAASCFYDIVYCCRGPSFGDAGHAKANLDSAFAVLDSILTELGKADESVHLEAERAKHEAEAKYKAAEAMKVCTPIILHIKKICKINSTSHQHEYKSQGQCCLECRTG